MVAGVDFLTTKSTDWSLKRLNIVSPWTEHGDGVSVIYKEGEEVPLRHIDVIASAGGDGGCVEKCYCHKLNKDIAVKKVLTQGDEGTNGELTEHMGYLRTVNHYHCIQVLGNYIRDDWFNIVMEPVATCDLRTYLMHEGSSHKIRKMELLCGPRTVFLPTIMGCLAHSLYYLHQNARLRHRDIKPANILLEGRRVLFADFDISKAFTETRSGTTGPSAKTPMYTSPERAANLHRNPSCDIFSLGCVYAEIFTVYKGRTVDEFYAHRRAADKLGDGYYYRTVPEVIEWLEDLATERCDAQIIRLLRSMLHSQPDQRPQAEDVWKTLTACSSISKRHFCGPCCMPLLYNDPLLTEKVDTHPSEIDYASSRRVQGIVPIPRDTYFQTSYDRDQELGLDWVRCVQHWDRSTLDVVCAEEYPHPLARKTITVGENDKGHEYAQNEAEILRNVKHRHIVTLHGTYRQGDSYALLYEPAANFDLRSYMELAELEMMRARDLPVDISFLNTTFGCMADALACVHAAGYDHGDIRPGNILVDNDRIFFSGFTFGLKTHRARGGSNGQRHRFIDIFGRLGLGQQAGEDVGNDHGHVRKTSVTVEQYKPPEWKRDEAISVGRPKADIFSLGCVFLEIYTVISGRRIRDFEAYRADEEGRHAYCYTLPKTLKWLSDLDVETYETKDRFQGILRRMIDEDPSQRPEARDVCNTLRQCKSSDGKPRCGSFCSLRNDI